jgi:tight adherence protein C
MAPILPDWSALAPDVALVVCAYSLILGGSAFILAGARARRDIIGERVALVTRSLGLGWMEKKAPRETNNERLEYGPGANSVEREVIRRFARLGVPPRRALALFLGLRFVALSSFGLLAALAGPYVGFLGGSPLQMSAFAVGAAVLGWYWPELVIRDMAKARAEEVVAGLPDALDLLVICAEAGLALEDGIERVAAELKLSQPVLADELLLTAADLKVLPSSEQALAKLAERVESQPVRSLVGTLSQTMRYGTPLAQAMRVVATQIRNDALLSLEERANKLPALMTIPMIVLIMPTIYLILAGPAALNVIDVLGLLR